VRFMPDEVSVLFEGEIEDFNELEELQANDNPILIENDNHKITITSGINKTANKTPQQPAQPAVAVDRDNGHRKRICIESAYICCIQEGKNATTLPQDLQMVSEKAIGEEKAERDWQQNA
jgi:hypothetical protein